MIQVISGWVKKWTLIIWMIVLLIALYALIFHRDILTASHLVNFLWRFGPYLLIVYFLLSVLRGFTLVPSTPFVLAGILLFPSNLPFVYVISLLWIIFSSSMVYFFSREMGFEKIFQKHKGYEKTQKLLEKYGFPFVAIWSFVIIVPTDLVCYLAGTMKMNYSKFILAVTLGEWLICIPLVFWGGNVIEFFLSRFF